MGSGIVKRTSSSVWSPLVPPWSVEKAVCATPRHSLSDEGVRIRGEESEVMNEISQNDIDPFDDIM
ncbi:MAG: hypothetical protein VYA30_07755 [Myxococcota bacterium]|nr:hypothetical protein [Myxococcota bacterium]